MSHAARLRQLMNGYQITQTIHVAAVLGIADVLADGALPVDAIAARTGTHPAALRRLLRGLAAIDILREMPDDRFATTELGDGLRTDAEVPIVGWAAFNGVPYHWAAWSALLHSVRTNENAFRHVHGKTAWEYRAADPEANAVFDGAMTAMSRYFLPSILAAYDFGGFPVIADIGGGRGGLLAAILRRCPASRGILFDQPHVLVAAPELLAANGVADRVELVAGSFFDRVPVVADAYLLKDILHDWTDDEAVRLLRVLRGAVPDGASLLVLERLLDADGFAAEVTMSDLNMLIGPGGAERSTDGYRDLLAAAGWRVDRVVPTTTEIAVIEAVPAA
jgi:hypothetical protein